MGKHARFSPSTSKRWLTCTKSMLLPEQVKRGQTSYANRGTALHEMAEDILLGKEISLTYEGYTPTEEDIKLTVIPYCEYVDELDVDKFWIEKKVFITEDCYGTADYIGYSFKTRTLHVVDLKAGKGVMVYAQNNTQARIYAIGAIKMLKELELEMPEKVVTHIVQPGIDNYGVEEVSVENLLALHNQVKATINMIKNGDGEYAPSDEACRWCPHKINCPKLNDFATQVAMEDFKDNTPLAEKMKMVPALKHFIKAVEDESFKILDQGKDLPGFKLIKGRGSRKWVNEEKLIAELDKVGMPESFTYAPSKILSVAQMEKSFKKNEIEFDLSEFIEKQEGSLKVVADDMPGKKVNKVEDSKEVFKNA